MVLISIDCFNDEPNLSIMLRALDSGDGVIEDNEVDRNHDGFLDFDPNSLRMFSSAEFKRLQIRLFECELVKKLRSENEIELLYERMPKFIENRIEAWKSKKRPDKYLTDFLFTALNSTQFDSTKDVDVFMDGVKFLVSLSGKRLPLMTDVFPVLGLDIKRCSEKKFSQEYVSKINAYVTANDASDQEIFCKLAKLINRVYYYEMDTSESSMLGRISRGLNDRSAYLITSLGSGCFEPLCAHSLWKTRNAKDAKKWLEKIDPDEEYWRDFTLALSKFAMDDVIRSDRDFFFKIAVDTITKRKRPIKNSQYLMFAFDTIFSSSSDREKIKYADRLLDEFRRTDISKETHGCISFLMKYYGPKYGLDKSSPELKDEVERLPEIIVPEIPSDEWIADGKLEAHLFFYDREWYEATKQFYRKNGWHITSTSTSTSDETTVAERMHNDIKFVARMFLNSGADNELGNIRNEDWDIRVHRHHGETVPNTFPDSKQKFEGKLMLDGSCGSFENIISEEFDENYSGNYFIGDTNTAYGSVNITLLDDIMNLAAKHSRSWGLLDPKYKRHGIILPHHPQLLVRKYVETLEVCY